VFNKDLLKLITREAGKDVATIVQKTEEASRARAEARAAESEFETKVLTLEGKMKEMMTTGVESAAFSGALGFGLGGAIAFIAHDQVASYFGKGSWPALLTLPGAGLLVLAVTPSFFKDKKKGSGENATTRAASYGTALGLLGVGGYFSYQDYMATP
jgi:hypothetical protein